MLGNDPNDPNDRPDIIVMVGCIIVTVLTVFFIAGGFI